MSQRAAAVNGRRDARIGGPDTHDDVRDTAFLERDAGNPWRDTLIARPETGYVRSTTSTNRHVTLEA